MSRRGLARVLAVAVMAGGASLVASCNVLLSLNKYVDCPGDPSCPADATCGDGVKDGTETDVDCGGPCSPCADGKDCKANGDCTSAACVSGTCLATTCGDNAKDGNETDVDCGGSCSPCADGKGCVTGSDCKDKVCSAGSCLPPSCTDKVQNGTETGLDCGGSCPGCGFGEGCATNTDCIGMLCTGEKCAATCSDGVKDGAETGMDCGGPTCMPCAAGSGCLVGTDCQSDVCQAAMCAATDVWSKSFDDSSTGNSLAGLGMTLDATGDVLLTGTFNGSFPFGVTPLGSGGQSASFIAKFDKNGTFVWDNERSEDIAGLAADAAGNAYVTGAFQTSMSWGANCSVSSPANGSVFLAKLDPTGAPLWCQGFGTSGVQVGEAVTIDSTGNVTVMGLLLGTTDFGKGGPLTGTSLSDRFLFHADSGGTVLWAQALLSSGLSGVSVDGAGNVYVIGLFTGTTNFGPTSTSALTSVGADGDLVVAKFDVNGTYAWSKSFGAPGATDDAASIAVDAAGDVFLTGSFSKSINFGGGAFTTTGTTEVDSYLAKLDTDGNHLWSKHFVDAFTVSATSVSLDALGQPTVIGSFADAVDLSGESLMATGGQQGSNIFVVKFDAAGNSLWARNFGDGSAVSPSGVAIDSTGAAVLTGTFNGVLDFGGNPMTSAAGSTDIFLAKLSTP